MSLQAIFSHKNFDFWGKGESATSFAAIDMIASSIANLSGDFFNRADKQVLKDFPLYKVLQNPNLDDTRFLFFYQSVDNYFREGNIYWFLSRNDSGDIVAIYNLDPKTVTVKKDQLNRKIFTHDGREYLADTIIHIPSRFSYDGLTGKSISHECGHIFRLSSDLDEYVNKTLHSGLGSHLILDMSEFSETATLEEKQRMQELFKELYTGTKNIGKPLVKSKGIKYEMLDTKHSTNAAAQLAENREFQIQEIAKLFGIPIQLISGKITNNNLIESLYVLYTQNAILPIASQLEDAICRMIDEGKRERVYFEFSFNSLLKTSARDRFDIYGKQLEHGILNIDEVRYMENRSPIQNGAGGIHTVNSSRMPVKPEIWDSYMAEAQTKKAELEKMNSHSPGVSGNHSNIGDDKGK